ncbi:HPr family phosphocarrier protein [Pseudodesulfovibrio piezophilus]|uniref:Phosphocarrier protein HPr n=1 Tax=Pseudodesulfovibrio piezophilus (strain DSM 21447 / JCM 15486 / C1TLV30) TaxID=1322246 RepID=M1WSJ8_PSEP2|nr:HPr family phosphocarrier protein [Pseudodesulfovibrio piezophilus]CCH48922.1 Phosphocarrier protein HPr [Pseudodesulfovibrio piezophilus C1TLV30]
MTFDNQTPGAESGKTESRQVVVANEHGLHARPAGKLAQKAQAFQADILIVHDEQVVDAKSILDVLTLAAGPGEVLEIRATGSDAAEAADVLEALFKNNFEE